MDGHDNKYHVAWTVRDMHVYTKVVNDRTHLCRSLVSNLNVLYLLVHLVIELESVVDEIPITSWGGGGVRILPI